MRHIEGVGPHFDFEKYQQARRKTISVVKEVSSNVFLGMSEEEGAKLVEETLKKYGAEKKWHPTKFRIGKNTTKSFKEKLKHGYENGLIDQNLIKATDQGYKFLNDTINTFN